MKSSNRKLGLSAWLVVLAIPLAGRGAHATDYYVATTGSDSNAGTMAAPFATLQKGVNTAVAGDTVYIRGGTYSITTPATSGAGINFTKSGTATSPINYFAYPGEIRSSTSRTWSSRPPATRTGSSSTRATCTSRGSRSATSR